MRADRWLAILLCVAGSCSTPAEEPQAARRVRAEELPEREREVWDAYRKGGGHWEIARESLSGDPELARFVVDNLVIDMVRSYERARLAAAGEREGPFERAQAELVLLKQDSTPVLAELCAVGDGIVAYLAADTLQRIGADAEPAVLALLDQPKPEARRRAVEWLAKASVTADREDVVVTRLARVVRDDPAWIVRAEAARALGVRGSKQASKGAALGALSRALRDEDPSVGEMAAVGFELLGDPRAIPALIDALDRFAQQGNVAGARVVEHALAELSGDPKPKSADAWRAWWERNQASLPRRASGDGR